MTVRRAVTALAVAGLALGLSVAVAAPAVAAPAPGWRPDQRIPGNLGYVDRLEVNPAGAMVATGVQGYYPRTRSTVATRTASGRWSSPKLLYTSDTRRSVAMAWADVDDTGRSVVVWYDFSPSGVSRLWSAQRTATGAWTTKQRVPETGAGILELKPSLETFGMSARGTGTFVFLRDDAVFETRLVNGRWTTPAKVSDAPAGQYAVAPQVSVRDSGWATVVWTERGPGATAGPKRAELDPSGRVVSRTAIAGAGDFVNPVIATSATGDGTVLAWFSSWLHPAVTVTAAWKTPDGVWHQQSLPSTPDYDGNTIAVAMAGSRVSAAWSVDTGDGESGARLLSSDLAGARWTTPREEFKDTSYDESGQFQASIGPALALSSTGTRVLGYSDYPALNGGDGQTVLATRVAGTTYTERFPLTRFALDATDAHVGVARTASYFPPVGYRPTLTRIR